MGILLLKKNKYAVFYLAIILLEDEASTKESYPSSLEAAKPQLFLTSLP